jgi:hypothetical protein
MANHFKFSGDYFVSAIGGNDSNAGTDPSAPFKTIGAAVTAAQAAGDYKQIIIGTGVYQETIAMGSAYGYHTFQGDGEVYVEGTGNTFALTGYHRLNWFKNINFLNWTFQLDTGEQQEPQYVDCGFRDIIQMNDYRQRYNNAYYANYTNCTFEGCGNWKTNELETGTYNNCVLRNSNTTGLIADGSGIGRNTANAQMFNGCILDNPNAFVWSGTPDQGTSFKGCVFTANTRVAYYDTNLSDYTYNSNDYMGGGASYGGFLTYGPSDVDPIGIIDNNTGTFNIAHPSWSAAMQVGIASMYRDCYYVNEIDYNTQLSGSGMFNNLADGIKFGISSSLMYKSTNGTGIIPLGGTTPSIAYGYESSSTNPLHPMGGATWQGITTSSLGGFQIDGSEHSGSIISAVIDQGAPKIIDNIGIGFSTTAPNAAAPSTYPSGANNHNPVRYQYEMRYGNASDLSSETYRIFEWGQEPRINSNGTGSGDQLYDSGSYSNISARYLQLKMTLRIDMSGSL